MARKNTARIEQHDRDMKALRLRQEGKTYSQIARECEFNSRQTAFAAVMRLVKRHEAEGVDEMRALEGTRLDRLQSLIWPDEDTLFLEAAEKMELKQLIAAKETLLATVDRLLRISERRSRLFGLDAPVRNEVTGLIGFTVDLGLDDDGDAHRPA